MVKTKEEIDILSNRVIGAAIEVHESGDGEKAPVKTGTRQEVQVLYGEGLANHSGPKSCGGAGNNTAEA